MTQKQTFDFLPRDDASDDAPTDAGPDTSSDFFIDGWDAYKRWLDELRDQLEPGTPDSG